LTQTMAERKCENV